MKSRLYAYTPISQINITSLVDVTMVLLIVFILITPIMLHGINVQLPQASSKRMDISKDAVTISISKHGKIYLDNARVTHESLKKRLKIIVGSTQNTSVIIKADKFVKYGEVVKVLDIVRKSGISRVGLPTRVRDIHR
ncbi:biopolymer transporter ExbD [bacterium]|nr:biopolymer transporter ExbD [bacterium]